MKFNCLKENLAKKLSIVTKAVPLKHSFPVLSNVLIEAKNGRLKISGTNLDTAISSYVGASVEEEGSITIPARQFLEYLNHMSVSDTLGFYTKGDALHLDSKSSKSKFNGVPASDFPDLPELPEDLTPLEISPKEFANAVSMVNFSVALDDTRPVFSGIFMNYSGGFLTFVGSDGHRLTERIIPVSSDVNDFSVVVPAKTLSEIARIFSSMDDNLKIYIDDSKNLCLFECDDIFVSSRMIEGVYPDYKRIIPSDSQIEATFNVQKLLEAVKLTSVFTKDSEDNALRLVFDPEGFIRVGSYVQEIGEHNSDLEANVTGELNIVFNTKYLLEFLSNSKFDEFIFYANDNASPCVIKPSGDEQFLHLMAPIQLND